MSSANSTPVTTPIRQTLPPPPGRGSARSIASPQYHIDAGMTPDAPDSGESSYDDTDEEDDREVFEILRADMLVRIQANDRERNAELAEIERLRARRDNLLQEVSALRAIRGYLRSADGQAALPDAQSLPRTGVSENPLAGASVPRIEEIGSSAGSGHDNNSNESALPHGHGILSDTMQTVQPLASRAISTEHREALNTAAPIIQYTREEADAILGRMITQYTEPGQDLAETVRVSFDRMAELRWYAFRGRMDVILSQIESIHARAPSNIDSFLRLMRRGFELVEEISNMLMNDETICLCQSAT